MRKAQNIVEYTILLCIVLSALLIMQVYVKRSYQGRLKAESDSIGPQYSVGHTKSSTTSTTTSVSETYVGGTTKGSEILDTAKDVPMGVSFTASKTKTTSSKSEEVDSFAEDDFNP
ncbi:MAG: hypothetical protein JSW17_03470 [Candidatus Omnitrophota bacterium]|nr:MAG: hypothetical protein JSW17_03470 [Candidatus Omnitrophota bacterium]